MIEELKKVLGICASRQMEATTDWHAADPQDQSVTPSVASLEELQKLVIWQHHCNYTLWHIEDEARRVDVDDTVIAACKRSIDKANQLRNDVIEKVDTCLLALLTPALPKTSQHHYNTESPGLAVDRLSILALKIYHMKEQTERTDVSEAHRASCCHKLSVLTEQRSDLLAALLQLIDEYAKGLKSPKLYYQFKMYNDPALNPSLYKNK